MSDYFDEHAPDPDPNDPEQSGSESIHIRRLRVLAALNGLEVELDAPEASKEAIAKLKEYKATKDEQIECPICKKISEEDEIFKVLPCGHKFHEPCILPWFQKTNSCPMCRYELETDDPDYEEIRRFRQDEPQRRERVDNLLNSMFT